MGASASKAASTADTAGKATTPEAPVRRHRLPGNQTLLRLQATAPDELPMLHRKCASCAAAESGDGEDGSHRVQAKLAVSAPHDPDEREADAVADRVMRRIAGGTMPVMPPTRFGLPALRRACATCGAELDEDEEAGAPPSTLHRRATDGRQTASAGVVNQLAAARGGGQPLPAPARRQMEQAFGADFASVRIHTDSRAVRMSRSLGAQAFAYGNNLFFDGGRFDPASREGKRLLAHELAHVLQQRPDRLHRQDEDSGKLKAMGLTLLSEEGGRQIVQVTLEFEKKAVAFRVLVGSGVSLVFGKQPIKAVGFDESREVRDRAVLFEVPESTFPYLWIIVPADTPERVEDLKRARADMLKHGGVTLTVTSEEIGGGQEGTEGTPAAPPKFVAAEDWLTKEMLPAVQKLLADREAAQRPDKLIGYVSLPIQEKEGTDVSMIQIEKNDTAGRKRIAGHQRVYRSRWVGQGADAQQKYAEETATAIAAKVQAAGKAERVAALAASQAEASAAQSYPVWAIQIRKQVEARLDDIRKKSPGRLLLDMPDKLFLTMLGGDPFFRIFIEQPAVNDPNKLVWNSGLVTPPLNEDQLKDIDGVVKIVRTQSAMLRQLPVRFVEDKDKDKDKPARTIVLMPEIPAEIVPLNLSSSGASTTGAENEFRMSVRIDRFFSMGPLMGADIAQALGLNTNDYQWKAERLTADNAAQLVRAPARPNSQQKPGDVYFDLSNKAIDQPTKLALAQERIDYASILANEAYPVVTTNSGPGFKFEFPVTEGIYLILCQTTPKALDRGEEFRHVFPPSRAIYPVRVLKPETLAMESVNETPNAIREREQLRDNPKLTEDERKKLDAEIKQLRDEEQMSHLQLAEKAATDIDGKLTQFRGLKTWMIEDRRKNPTTIGTADTDPFVVRLLMQDKIYDTRYFGAWQELYGLRGDEAYSVKDLELDHTTPEGQRNPLNHYIALLESQKAQAARLIGILKSEAYKFKDAAVQRPAATLIAKETGQAMPLLLLLGEAMDSAPGAYKYMIVDLTLFANDKLYKSKDHVYVSDVFADRQTAIGNAFARYGEENKYPEGELIFRIAPDTTAYKVRNIKTIGEYAEDAAMILALIGLIASVAASGGATTPALAVFVAVVSVANAVLAGALAYRNLSLRRERGTFEMDADAALDVINIIASAVSLGSLGKLLQLGKAARVATAAGAAGRAAQITAQIQRIGKLMLVFDAVTLGATAALTSIKVAEDIARVRGLGLPKAQEDALLRDVAVNAIMQGAMLAFQTVALARSHLEAYRSRVEESKYRNLEERGWVDGEGKVTENAPPFLRAGAKGEATPTTETPPVKLEDELPMIKEAYEAGKTIEEPATSDYDLAIPIVGKDGKEHTYYRRRSDGGFCRHSPARFCFISKADIDAILRAIGALDEPSAGKQTKKPPAKPRGGTTGLPGKTSKGSPGKTAGETATLTQDIEAVVDTATANVREEVGKQWLLPHIYGTKLHKAAADLFRRLKLPQGWRALVDRALRFAGVLKQKTADLTVEAFFEKHPEYAWLKSELPESLLKKKIGDIEPDLVLFAPDGTIIVWDLAPGLTPEHLGKTLLYTFALGESGKRFQIGETYYRPQRHIQVSAKHQARFTGTAGEAEGAVVSTKLSDDDILSLLRNNAGEGKPLPADLPTNPKARALLEAHAKKTGKPIVMGDVPLGYHGSAELITGKTKVVGRYFDSRKNVWVDTKNFSIHYTESGLYLRPEAP